MDRYWLPECADLDPYIKSCSLIESSTERWNAIRTLAGRNIDFASMLRLDRVICRERTTQDIPRHFESVKLAILSTSTTSHLAGALRVASLARGIALEVYEPHYSQGRQDLADPHSNLHRFAPNAVLFAQDPYSLFGVQDFGLLDDGSDAARALVTAQRAQWRYARDRWGATILQQVPFNPMPRLLGENEARLLGSAASLVATYQDQVRLAAAQDGVDLVDLDHWAMKGGLSAWHSPALWNRSKQDVHPAAAPVYGDLIARLLAARYGRSAKCLVLDLDNTLWGGVIGDDGMEGIVIGQGSAVGEGFLAFQSYAKQLSKRGIVLAVCSKNDDIVARKPFQDHPDMILRLEDIGCFVANWTDKATNIRRIAAELNLGLDSLVFADDSPFERELVRRELPVVFVPKLSDEPSEYATIIADSGYFEGVAITQDDLGRSEQYQSNARRRELREGVTDLDSYLSALNMTLTHSRFDEFGLRRIAQLINKTNQFNLTTRRYTEAEVERLMSDPQVVTRQLRLVDRYGDNGIVAVIIAYYDERSRKLDIDTWLMSCRVLGRKVESATLQIIVDAALALGATSLSGRYIRTDRNGMVQDHYANLGFTPTTEIDGTTNWVLMLSDFRPTATKMRIEGVP